MKNVTLKTAKEVRELDFLDGEWSLERLRADYDQLRWQFQNVPKYAEALMGLDNNLVHLEGILSDLSPEETWVSSPFLVDRVYGLRSLATRLISAKRPVDAWLASLPATRGALAKCRDASSDESKLHTALVQDLNTAIDGPSIYDAKRFQGIPLRADTQALKLEKPKGVALRCLNRLLLEDAYPLELARRNTWPEGAKRAFEEAIMAGLRFMALKIAAEWPRGGRTDPMEQAALGGLQFLGSGTSRLMDRPGLIPRDRIIRDDIKHYFFYDSTSGREIVASEVRATLCGRDGSV